MTDKQRLDLFGPEDYPGQHKETEKFCVEEVIDFLMASNPIVLAKKAGYQTCEQYEDAMSIWFTDANCAEAVRRIDYI